MRSDSKKNLKKVAAVALKHPEATRDEIARKAGVSHGTASNKLAELSEGGKINRTSQIVDIAKNDLEIVEIAQRVIRKSMVKYEEQVMLTPADIKHVSSVAEQSQKRQSFLEGSNSDDSGGEIKVTFQE